MKYLPEYSLIDQKATGEKLKSVIRESGYRVSEIQEFLSFSGPQPIYRWFRGKALPSLHHLCALSELLDVPVDELLVRDSGSAAGYGMLSDFELSDFNCPKSSALPNNSARTANYNSYKLSPGTAGASRGAESVLPLRIDIGKTGNMKKSCCAVGMYGVALLARQCMHVMISAS